MASTHARQLFTIEELTASKTSDPKETLSGDVNFIAFLKSENVSSANYAVKIQHSPNNLDWFDLLSFSAVTTNTTEKVILDNTNDFVFNYIRCVVTRTTGDVDLTVHLYYDRI